MSRGIIGVTVGTPISPKAIERKIKPVKTVNGVEPDESGNVDVIGNAGADGKTPFIGENGNWWIGEEDTGVKAQGKDGTDGKTPEKGTDYYTDADKAEMVSAVLDALPVYDGEYEVTPSTTEELTLLTARTFVGADVKVAKIPYYEVSNNSGGKTANIGG